MQPLFHDLRQGVAVIPLGVLPCGIAELLFCALDAGRVGAPGDGAHIVVDHGGDLAGVLYHHLVGFFLGQIVELRQHILRGTEEQRRLVIGILKAVARLLDAGAVELLDPLLAIHLAVPHHIGVVAQRLDLKDIVVGGDLFQLLVAGAVHNGAVQLACLTGAGEQQAVPVLVQQTAGHAGLFEEVVDMRLADDLVQVLQSHLVFDQNDEVIVLLFQHLAVAAQTGVDLADLGHLFFR